MTDPSSEKFIVRADYFSKVVTNARIQFWFPQNRGNIIIDKDVLTYSTFGKNEIFLQIPLKKIIKVKTETLRPGKNRWVSGLAGSPYYLLFWIPFWNRYILNLTILDDQGFPWEHFFRLKTKKITAETFAIIKKATAR
ncbi:MAG: hypothetical protein ACOY4Q_07315 [Bacillota bacterium]